MGWIDIIAAKFPSLSTVTLMFSTPSRKMETLLPGDARPARIVSPSASKRTSSIEGEISLLSIGEASLSGLPVVTSTAGLEVAGTTRARPVFCALRLLIYNPAPTAAMANATAATTIIVFELVQAVHLDIIFLSFDRFSTGLLRFLSRHRCKGQNN